jgi:hypothetical protein
MKVEETISIPSSNISKIKTRRKIPNFHSSAQSRNSTNLLRRKSLDNQRHSSNMENSNTMTRRIGRVLKTILKYSMKKKNTTIEMKIVRIRSTYPIH